MYRRIFMINLGEIGKGGFGIVSKIQCSSTNKFYALKEYSEHGIQNLSHDFKTNIKKDLSEKLKYKKQFLTQMLCQY